MTSRNLVKRLPLAILLTPALAFASTTTDLISQLAGLFYIIVGLTLVMSLILMMGGTLAWAIRLGTFPTYRDDALTVIEYGVSTMFVLVVILGIVEFVQTHTSATLYVLSIVIAGLVLWLAVTSELFGGGAEKEEEH